jgi:hypothetical protein
MRAVGENCFGGPNFIAELSTRRIRRLPHSGGFVHWTADGREVAWSTFLEQHNGIRTASVASDHPATLPIWGTYFEWSPNGAHLLVCRPDGLWVTTADGTSKHHIVRTTKTPDAHSADEATPFAHWADDATIIYRTGYR